jgi:DNA-binding NtrC family response regulator
VTVDVRVIAATNQDLETAIREGRFREDLFYRLNVIPIEVPALRDRREDVPLLIQYFLDVLNQERGTKIDSVSDEAMAMLVAYEWPGNVRELENLVERLTVLRGEGEIEPDDLPPALHRAGGPLPSAPRMPADGLDLRDVVDQIETDLILQALEKTRWNKNQAAKRLGLSRTTLLEKLKKKGLSDPQD